MYLKSWKSCGGIKRGRKEMWAAQLKSRRESLWVRVPLLLLSSHDILQGYWPPVPTNATLLDFLQVKFAKLFNFWAIFVLVTPKMIPSRRSTPKFVTGVRVVDHNFDHLRAANKHTYYYIFCSKSLLETFFVTETPPLFSRTWNFSHVFPSRAHLVTKHPLNRSILIEFIFFSIKIEI
jgi:hypothetical protein